MNLRITPRTGPTHPFALLLAASALSVSGCNGSDAMPGEPTSVLTSNLESVTALEISPDGQLFIADSFGGMLHAIDLSGQTSAESQHFNVRDLDRRIAESLGVPRHDVQISDLVVHPRSFESIVGVNYTGAEAPLGLVMSVSATGELSLLDTSASETLPIPAPHTDGVVFWKTTDARLRSVTDLDYSDGRLYVAARRRPRPKKAGPPCVRRPWCNARRASRGRRHRAQGACRAR